MRCCTRCQGPSWQSIARLESSGAEDAIEQLVAQNLGISIVAETESLELYDNIQVLRPSWLNDGRYLYLTYHTLRHQGNGVKEMISYIRKTFVKD